MDYTPVPITKEDFDELLRCQELYEGFGHDNSDDFLETLQDLYIVKFPGYITDGPGYAGPLIVIVTGIMNAIFVIKVDDKLKIQWPSN